MRVRHLLWYTKRWCHKNDNSYVLQTIYVIKFATSPTLNNCLAKINISGSFLNRPRISARYKYLVRSFDFVEPCVLVGKPVQYELFPVSHTL